MRALGLAALLLLTGCLRGQIRTGPGDKRMEGTPIHDLVEQWGPPVNVFQNGQDAVYTWRFDGEQHSVGSAIRTSRYSAFGSSRSWQEFCERNFNVDPGGFIVSSHWRGNICAEQ